MRLTVVVLVLVLALAGCGESPTGRSQLALVPNSMMTDMGQQAFARMKEEMSIERGEAANRLVACVAREIIAASAAQYPEADMPDGWEVVVFDNPSANAFALPGGRIGVHSGLLRVAETPDQLAAVIGHEVGHVLANHGNERLTQQLGIKVALIVVGLLSEGGVGEQPLLQALGIGAQLGVALPFSRAHEREADVMGLRIMADAGFRPEASVALWRNMAEQSQGQPMEFLSTHPAHDSRIELLESNLPAAMESYRQAEPARCG